MSTDSGPKKPEVPEWAKGVYSSTTMVEGSEEHLMWKLKYGTIEDWWQDLVDGEIDKLD